ncbi:SRA stem-loop-interacting RNA-binding protein, mitochondrial [Indicator indicator]|uniref:SRA stem-loop-interacting RNA-binding protein, mitochondrial n=1 Tax=Indicator indicator TaxID=1002788 RepID=UPI0023DF9AEC|nr:SRA stem-loop-interacting RNA-binding protein, mitochondrial [Indicator indicator]
MAVPSAVRAVGRGSRKIFDIFVAEVPWTVSSKELKEYFSQFGSVQRCQLPFDKDTGFHKRYCWIKFSTPQDVQNVFQKDIHILEGAKLTLKKQSQRRYSQRRNPNE